MYMYRYNTPPDLHVTDHVTGVQVEVDHTCPSIAETAGAQVNVVNTREISYLYT